MRSDPHSAARGWLATLLLGVLLCAPALALQAEDIDAAKQSGVVGEQEDGYLGLVSPDAPPEVRALVETVNTRRRGAYEGIAAKNGTSAQDVARLAGAKLIERAPVGQYVKDATGAWKKK